MVCLCGTLETAKWTKNIVDSLVPSTTRKESIPRQLTSSNTYEIRFGGKRALKLYEIMHNKNIPVLNCKWEPLMVYYEMKKENLHDTRTTPRNKNNGRFTK